MSVAPSLELFPSQLCIALGAIALSEVVRSAVLSPDNSGKTRGGWLGVCLCLLGALDRASWPDSEAFRWHAAFALVTVVAVALASRRFSPDRPAGFLLGNSGVLIATPAWLIGTGLDSLHDTVRSYLVTLACALGIGAGVYVVRTLQVPDILTAVFRQF